MTGPEAAAGKRRLPLLLLAVVGTLLLLFLAFRLNWFGAPLEDSEVLSGLRSQSAAQPVQHALEQLVARFSRRDAAAVRGDFSEALGALSAHPQWEVRRAAAWAMGHDPQGRNRPQLVLMLKDADRGVRINAAVALANYNDAAGLGELRDALVPWAVLAPADGVFSTRAKAQEALSLGRDLGSIGSGGNAVPVRVELNGWLHKLVIADGGTVARGAVLAEIAPDAATLLNVLLALQFVGAAEDAARVAALADVNPCARQLEVAAQCTRTLEALRRR